MPTPVETINHGGGMYLKGGAEEVLLATGDDGTILDTQTSLLPIF